MRLWHKDLIPYLPRQQLVSQWRECCAIAARIKKSGTPNHILVNPITLYKEIVFVNYCNLVYNEMIYREYKVDWEKLNQHLSKPYTPIEEDKFPFIDYDNMFRGWHNFKYLRQCYYNLEEKWMCHGISNEEWEIIYDKFYEIV